MRFLLRTIWNTPWLLALVSVLVVIGIIAWIMDQIKETREGEELRKKDRR
jgi:putative effector of murein hydrolase LrgA (UPF0299 family)